MWTIELVICHCLLPLAHKSKVMGSISRASGELRIKRIVVLISSRNPLLVLQLDKLRIRRMICYLFYLTSSSHLDRHRSHHPPHEINGMSCLSLRHQ